jgi:glucose/arabinose dehydrogenase
MKTGRAWVLGVVAVLAAACGVFLPPRGCGAATPLDAIRLPQGFQIALFAGGVEGARSLALGERGTVFVGTREAGRVYALVDGDRDGVAERVVTIAQGLTMPNGVAFRDGALFVAEVSRIIRYDGIEGRLETPPSPSVVRGDFPTETHHGWKFIAFGPDGLLYVPVGAPCNICESADDRFASVTRMRPDGTGFEVFAKGVRNTVGFAWHPVTREFWFTDNGRDMLGDNFPPDELNRAPRAGMHFGFPYRHGAGSSDPEFGQRAPAVDFVPPVQALGAHVASLGMRFYTGTMFPPEYRNRIFIAEHGSWNRSSPVGYRLTTVTLDGDRAVAYEPFAEGWLRGMTAWGRPVDLLVMPDGAILVSDDRAGAVYRITWGR